MKKTRLVSLMLCALMASSVAACSGKGGGDRLPPEAEGKTVLKVAVYEGGLGTAWMTQAAEAFGELYKDKSFEEGKTGVYVDVQAHKQFNGSTLLTGSIDKDLYFTEDVNYYTHVSRGNFADITDVMTGSLEEYGETGTVADKLTENQRSYLTARDGKYYGVPFYDGIYGLIYDRDMFSDNYWFFDENGDIGVNENGIDPNGSDLGLSKGPDNKADTAYDNGLPATYDQFADLMYEMTAVGKTPFAYMGSDSAYIKRAMNSWWSDYEGLDSMNVNYTLDGTIDVVTAINDGEVTTESVKIDQTNGYKLHQQPGKYYALKFLEILLGGGDNYKVNRDDHMMAQRNFVRGALTSDTDYAMLVDGIWWENEARAALDDCQKEFGKGRMERRFAFLPIPKANETELAKEKGQTLMSLNTSFGFISAKTKKMELAKKFMQFLHTDAQMSAFTRETSILRSFEYEVAAADEAKMSYFGKSVMETKRNSNIIYPCSNLDLINNNPGTFVADGWAWKTKIGTSQVSDPFAAFRQGYTAEQYFNGYAEVFTQDAWNGLTK